MTKAQHLIVLASATLFTVAVVPALAAPIGLSASIGPTLYHETYEEFNAGHQKFMQEEATMFGLDLRIDYGINTQFSVGGSYGYAVGTSTYTGSLMGQPYGSLSEGGIYRDRHQINLDATYRMLQGTGFTAGVAWRKLDDHMEKMSSGYRRENEITYATFGIDHPFHLASWTIQPSFTYKHLIEGNQFTGILGGINTKQHHGKGYDVSIAFIHALSSGQSLTITPFLRTWDIADSEMVKTPIGFFLFEPHNKTKELGVNMYWTF